MTVQAIGTTNLVLKGKDGLKNYQTLKIDGDAKKDDAPLEISFDGKDYSRRKIKVNGKEEVIYILKNEKPKAVEAKVAEKYTDEKPDGEDDGEISWSEKLWSMGKGIIKPFKDMFNFSNKKETFKSCLKIAAGIGLAVASIAFPVVGLALAGVGAVVGGATLATGIVQANKSKKDADTRNAYENIGNGAFTLITSLLGFKAMKNSIATKASAIDNANAAAATATGSAAPATQINQLGHISGSSTIKTGIMPNAAQKIKNLAGVVKPEVKPTLDTLNGIKQYNTSGLGLAKISCDTGITANQLQYLNNINAVNAYVREANMALNAKDITAAYTAAQKLRTIIPHIDPTVIEANKDTISNAIQLAENISSISKVTTSVKGTAKVIGVTGAGVENMFAASEADKLQAYEFAS